MEAINYKILSAEGKEAGQIELDPQVFGTKVNEGLVHDVTVWQLAKRRSGNASALTKAEVSGGGKKPWKQKGTGNARAGSNTSPLWVGGGVTHGPKPRDYTTRVSKRARTQALCSVLTEKRLSDKIKVVDDFNLKSGKTREFVGVLKKLGLLGEKVALLVDSSGNKAAAELVKRAAGNIPGVAVLGLDAVNVYDLLKYKYLLSNKADLNELQGKVIKQIAN